MQIEIVKRKVWKNKLSHRTASLYGAVPWQTFNEKMDWEVVERGWTVKFTSRNGSVTYGCGQPPFETLEEAEEFCKKHSSDTGSHWIN